MSLAMRPDCERCGRDLPPDSKDAMICSFECTFCAPCVAAMEGMCPNCGGDFAPRPTRAAQRLAASPADPRRRFRG